MMAWREMKYCSLTCCNLTSLSRRETKLMKYCPSSRLYPSGQYHEIVEETVQMYGIQCCDGWNWETQYSSPHDSHALFHLHLGVTNPSEDNLAIKMDMTPRNQSKCVPTIKILAPPSLRNMVCSRLGGVVLYRYLKREIYAIIIIITIIIIKPTPPHTI